MIASRYVDGGAADGLAGRWRRQVSLAAAGLARLLFPRRLDACSDPMSGFFLVRRAAVPLEGCARTGSRSCSRSSPAELGHAGERGPVRLRRPRRRSVEGRPDAGSPLRPPPSPAHASCAWRARGGVVRPGPDTDPRGAIEVDKRPWGGFQRLTHNAASTVKVIEVLPGCRLSLQRHESRRGELWLVLDEQHSRSMATRSSSIRARRSGCLGARPTERRTRGHRRCASSRSPSATSTRPTSSGWRLRAHVTDSGTRP